VARLSSPIENIKPHYTVVVVGSGYGGGIAASRMARAGQQVCVLERGKEFQPGEYPDTQFEATREMQTDLPAFHTGPRTGLYDLRVNEDINVFLGCGLGGTSLVNANVALRAEPRVFDDPRWPQAVRDDLSTLLEDGYRRAEEMLRPTPYPGSFPELPKLRAMEQSASQMGENFYRPPINVTFEDGVNHVGVPQQACKLCGDCCSGCNFAAKNTTLMNYLPDAWNHGAEIYTQVMVRHLERHGDLWRVHYEVLGAGRERFDSPTMFMTADVVILGAGTLGSTEILLRSRDEGLSLSSRLGHGFTGNGDVLAFGYNCDHPVNGVGVGPYFEEVEEPVGPCITGIIDLRERDELDTGMVIEEGVIPSPLGRLLAPAFAAASGLLGEDTDLGAADTRNERARELHSLVRGPYHGAVHNTQTFLVMSHDDSAGRMYLDDDRLRIEWPGVGSQRNFTQVNERLEEATRALGGTYLINPIWADWARAEGGGRDVVTVHPLGGCSMAESAETGVTNHKGQVFSSEAGDAAYEGLYVCDGAVVPRSLGVNPLLTISALAERTCALLARDRGWEFDYTLPSAPREMYTKAPLGIQFTESMKGYFSPGVTGDYHEGWEQGKRDGSRFEFTLTIISDDLERTLKGDEHSANILGTVVAPALSPRPMTVTGGEFNLFVKDEEAPGTRKMRYRMNIASEEGKVYYFDGFKAVRDDPGLDTWSDTTTLYITVHEGDSEIRPVMGKGILKIRPTDFMRQMTTMKVNNAENLAQALEANARFGAFFAGVVFSTYARFARSNRKVDLR
jgi:cholesterol oxidase